MARQDANWEEFLGREDLVLIDCRNADELSSVGKIETAIHIPCRMGDDPLDVAKQYAGVLPEKTSTILCYCAVGGRSARFAAALKQCGYLNVRNAGGYPAVKAKYQPPSSYSCCGAL